jgi:thioredoxin-like negative regulator of GroEL
VTRRKAAEPAAPADPLRLMVFGARWAAPWIPLQGALDRIAADGIEVERVDIDENDAAAERHRIISVPTVLVLRGEQERRRVTGAVSEADLRSLLRRR